MVDVELPNTPLGCKQELTPYRARTDFKQAVRLFLPEKVAISGYLSNSPNISGPSKLH